LIELPGLTSDI